MKEPMDYAMDYAMWILLFPLKITENNKNKNVRRFGILSCIPFTATWLITGIPFMLVFIISGIAQLWKDA